MRKADAGRLKFNSFEDILGHDVAFTSGHYVWPELRPFMREHPNYVVETTNPSMSLRMLEAGHVDYAEANLAVGLQALAVMGLSAKIQPILSRNTGEPDYRVCFTKTRVAPSFVDAFSRALKQFKQTEAYQAIYHKYFP